MALPFYHCPASSTLLLIHFCFPLSYRRPLVILEGPLATLIHFDFAPRNLIDLAILPPRRSPCRFENQGLTLP